MQEENGAVSEWHALFMLKYDGLIDVWRMLTETKAGNVPDKKFMQQQLYARSLFKMHIGQIWSALYDKMANGVQFDLRLRFRDTMMGPTHRNAYMLLQTCLNMGLDREEDILLLDYDTDAHRACGTKKLRSGVASAYWWIREAYYLRSKVVGEVNGILDVTCDHNDTDASWSENSDFELDSVAFQRKAKDRAKSITVKEKYISSPVMSPFLTFVAKLNPNNPTAREFRIALGNSKLRCYSQGIVLGDESMQCMHLCLAAGLGMDPLQLRGDIRFAAQQFVSTLAPSDKANLTTEALDELLELNKPGMKASINFLKYFWPAEIPPTDVLVLSKSSDGNAVADHFMHDTTKCNPRTIVLYFAHEHFNNVYASRTMSTVNKLIDSILPAENPDNWRHVIHQIGAVIGGANPEALSDSELEPYEDSDSSDEDDDLLANMKYRILSNKKAREGKNSDLVHGSGGGGAGKKAREHKIFSSEGEKKRPEISPQDLHAGISFNGRGRYLPHPVLDAQTAGYKEKMTYMQEASRQILDDPDAIHEEQNEKYANVDEVEKELNEKGLAAAQKERNRSSKKTLTTAQRGILLTEKWKGETWQDSSGDEAEYVIQEIKLLKPKARKLKVICTHKKTGRIVHEEGENISYIAKKLGFTCTDNGKILGSDDADDDADDDDTKAPAGTADV